jgi:hypothetical protein
VGLKILIPALVLTRDMYWRSDAEREKAGSTEVMLINFHALVVGYSVLSLAGAMDMLRRSMHVLWRL